ncbi:MAG: hypothetical protein ABR583_01380 [Gaiellaceae bacterium]
MTAQAAPLVAVRRREWLLVGLIASAAAAALALIGPDGGDTPAHLYRTFLVDQGVYLWDNLWFAGQYPLVSYSLLYYLPAALVGNVPVVIASVIASAVLFERVCRHEWGDAAMWPARVFAVLAAGPLFTGTYSYAAGFATLLATLAALQSGRVSTAVGCAALTLGFSPLAFVFLALVLAALVVARRPLGRKAALFGGGLVVAITIEVTALHLFPTGGRYPFRLFELAVVLVVAGLGLAIASRAPRGGVLAALFGCWLAASVLLFLVPEPVGENVTRLRSIVFPLMLLTALLARFRPRSLVVLGLGFALAYNVVPYAATVPARLDDTRASQEAFWAPAIGFLREHRALEFRVEVVPTYDHWESYWVPRSGFALARGWFRQQDLAENRVLYRQPLSPAAYRAWLRRMSIRYVLLPRAPLAQKGAIREARLLRSGGAGLPVVFRSTDWTIYQFRDARPLLTGPAEARVWAFAHDHVAGWVGARGTYRLGVRHMPYWRVQGPVCIQRAPDGMTWLRARRRGGFVLTLDGGPGALVRSPLRAGGACS